MDFNIKRMNPNLFFPLKTSGPEYDGDDIHVLTVYDLGDIHLLSGQVAVCDPFITLGQSLVVSCPVGTFPVKVTVADVSEQQDGSHCRDAYLSIIFSPEDPVSFQAVYPDSYTKKQRAQTPYLAIGVDSGTALAAAGEFQRDIGGLEGHAHKVAHGFSAAGGDDEGVARIGLQHAPHGVNVFLGKAPVALGVQVAQLQRVKLAQADFGDAVGDFAGDEFAPAQRAFVVEQDTAGGKDAVAFAVIDGHPVRIQLGDAVGAARVERGGFRLRHRLHQAEHFRCGGLVEAHFRIDDADGFQQVDSADAGDLRRGDGLRKGDANEALGSQVIDLGGLGVLQQADTGRQVGQVVFDQLQVRMVGNAQLLHAPEIDGAGAAKSAEDAVALFQQQLRKVGAILPGDACNNGFFHVFCMREARKAGIVGNGSDAFPCTPCALRLVRVRPWCAPAHALDSRTTLIFGLTQAVFCLY